ncbi:MAG TPA: HD domain-containing phosphohydrolase [Smithella sp.]|nr:HD domain-containing phosphohydrolase [Smithella sp.]
MNKINSKDFKKLFQVDRELIIIFLLVVITGFIFFFVANQRAFLNFFYLPVLLGAYFFGKRYATLAAFLSIILIFTMAYIYPSSFKFPMDTEINRWLDLLTWGGFLLVTGYAMGLLYEMKEEANREIEKTYQGVVEMLALIIDSVDSQTQSHSYRVSVISGQIARQMGCTSGEIENIRIAALLHDLGKIGVSGELLHKVGNLSGSERAKIKAHPQTAVNVIQPLGSKVLDILPLILSHHEKWDGSGYHSQIGDTIPLGARIIAIADVYDALISDRSYRKALSPFQAKKEIMDNVNKHFDPDVATAFNNIFDSIKDIDRFIFPLQANIYQSR